MRKDMYAEERETDRHKGRQYGLEQARKQASKTDRQRQTRTCGQFGSSRPAASFGGHSRAALRNSGIVLYYLHLDFDDEEQFGSPQLNRGREAKGERPPCDPMALGEQCRLAEKFRGLGVTCTACLDGPFCYKPHEMGEGCYKHMIAVLEVTSVGRPCDLCKQLDDDTRRDPLCKGSVGGRKHVAQPGQRKVQAVFRARQVETQHGAVLLYEPGELDKWSGSRIRHDSRTGNSSTWRPQKPSMSGRAMSIGEYRRYIQRHNQAPGLGGGEMQPQGGGGATWPRSTHGK